MGNIRGQRTCNLGSELLRRLSFVREKIHSVFLCHTMSLTETLCLYRQCADHAIDRKIACRDVALTQEREKIRRYLGYWQITRIAAEGGTLCRLCHPFRTKMTEIMFLLCKDVDEHIADLLLAATRCDSNTPFGYIGKTTLFEGCLYLLQVTDDGIAADAKRCRESVDRTRSTAEEC